MLSCATNHRKYGTSSHFGGHFVLANLKVKVTKYRMLSDRFEFSTHKFCKKQVYKYLSTPNSSQVWGLVHIFCCRHLISCFWISRPDGAPHFAFLGMSCLFMTPVNDFARQAGVKLCDIGIVLDQGVRRKIKC